MTGTSTRTADVSLPMSGALHARAISEHRRRAGEAELLSVAEVADRLRVALPTVYKWIRLERVSAVKNPLSGTMAITAAEVERIRPYVRSRD